MRLRALFQRLDDALNPIVVKELRQAVQSKFVIVVLLLFLLAQLAIVWIFLLVTSGNRSVEDAYEFQGGRNLFVILHGIMLGTCMLFLPLYTGIRLAAERSDTNTDLLFVTTLPPRAIIGGKLLAALVLAVMIFSTCTPFLFFTYLLRGIDWATIWFIVGLDFAAVALSVQLAIFLAVVPGHWIFRGLLGLVGLGGLVMGFVGVLGGTLELLIYVGVGALMESPDFWAAVSLILTAWLGMGALYYSWSVALLNPASANRALMYRVVLVVFWAVSLAVAWMWNRILAYPGDQGGPLLIWVWTMALLCCLSMVIAVNEREAWSPRMARSIPRPWWLRVPAFLFYSGAAGGLTLGCLLFVLTLLVTRLGNLWVPSPLDRRFVNDVTYYWNPWDFALEVLGIIGLYVFSYALTAVAVRRWWPGRLATGYTWVVLLALVAVGSAVPFLLSFLMFYGTWHFFTHYPWLLTNPFVAVNAVGGRWRIWQPMQWTFFNFAVSWASLAALVHIPWFLRQVKSFRPYASTAAGLARSPLPLSLTESQAATTKTV